ncbi:hypothetical protein NIES970_19370 [[Synechococcus] sp. NIES-970]|nr:hypothetical protein NIES970_19370 [[Synechococcus] sp. NIES-970]
MLKQHTKLDNWYQQSGVNYFLEVFTLDSFLLNEVHHVT